MSSDFNDRPGYFGDRYDQNNDGHLDGMERANDMGAFQQMINQSGGGSGGNPGNGFGGDGGGGDGGGCVVVGIGLFVIIGSIIAIVRHIGKAMLFVGIGNIVTVALAAFWIYLFYLHSKTKKEASAVAQRKDMSLRKMKRCRKNDSDAEVVFKVLRQERLYLLAGVGIILVVALLFSSFCAPVRNDIRMMHSEDSYWEWKTYDFDGIKVSIPESWEKEDDEETDQYVLDEVSYRDPVYLEDRSFISLIVSVRTQGMIYNSEEGNRYPEWEYYKKFGVSNKMGRVTELSYDGFLYAYKSKRTTRDEDGKTVYLEQVVYTKDKAVETLVILHGNIGPDGKRRAEEILDKIDYSGFKDPQPSE